MPVNYAVKGAVVDLRGDTPKATEELPLTRTLGFERSIPKSNFHQRRQTKIKRRNIPDSSSVSGTWAVTALVRFVFV